MARRHTVERVVAEVEDLLRSPRFEKYAAATGISQIAKPLLLAYLLHQRWVVKPMEGGKKTAELRELLSLRWCLNGDSSLSAAGSNDEYPPVESPAIGKIGLWADARQQLESAGNQLSNLFWEPSLNSKTQPKLGAQWSAHWPAASFASLIFAAVTLTDYYANPHLLFMPFYLIPCALLTWKLDRRWGALAATVAAIIGPLMQRLKDADFQPMQVTLWNVVMRFIILQVCVIFVDRLHRQKIVTMETKIPDERSRKLVDNWAVMLASLMWFAGVIWLQSCSNPNLIFMPLYLFPPVVLTLAMSWRWGTAAALLAALASPIVQSFGDPDYQRLSVGFWNIVMRFVMLQVMVLLLDHIRRENVLFFSGRTNPR